MILVISPAKALDYETPPTTAIFTQPDFLDHAAELIEVLREKSPAQIAELMSLSDPLSSLNVARYASWSRPFAADNAKPRLEPHCGHIPCYGRSRRIREVSKRGRAIDRVSPLGGGHHCAVIKAKRIAPNNRICAVDGVIHRRVIADGHAAICGR